jgi:hypothetical protein
LGDEAREIAPRIVRYLINDLQIDCLGLGEVTGDDLHLLKEQCNSASMSIVDGTDKKGKAQFDTGVLYNKSRLCLLDKPASIFNLYKGGTLKVANHARFGLPNSPTPLHLYVSHWPSRLRSEEGQQSRRTLGSLLKGDLDSVRLSETNPAIVLMGDYNDEPFNESLSDGLLATRERSVARHRSEFVYNPFWRHMGEFHPHSAGENRDGFCGTCHHSKNVDAPWKVFDQMFFSGFFLGSGDWHLNEERTSILRLPDELADEVRKTDGLFDHYPVISVIEQWSLGDPND